MINFDCKGVHYDLIRAGSGKAFRQFARHVSTSDTAGGGHPVFVSPRPDKPEHVFLTSLPLIP